MQNHEQKEQENAKGAEEDLLRPPSGSSASARWRKVAANVGDALRAVDAADCAGPGGRRAYGDLRAALLRAAEIAQAFGGDGSSGRWEEV